MVQKKVAKKLGIQDHHVESEKPSGNQIKPVTFQCQDGKSRGTTDLKKIMKKSKSIKLSNIDCFKSPLKQNLSSGSPNYMKSTSCSDAKKDRTQVSPRKTETSSDHKKVRSDSSFLNKPMRTLTRSSSLKLGRTLTKTPSFKLARPSSKMRSKVALCADINNPQRATCSSTLKDSKFPDYIMLNHGGTELDGTSVMKVCPYTYCSLNGHFHTPSPPLTSFLSAKRRLLKTQKNIILEALSLKGANASDNVGVVADEMASSQEEDKGFFIEFYARDEDDSATSESDIDVEDDPEIIDSTDKRKAFEDLIFLVADAEESPTEQDVESLFDVSPQFEIDFEDNLDEYYYSILLEMETTECFYGQFGKEDANNVDPSFVDSETSDMEWEDGQFSATYFDYGSDNPAQVDDEIDKNMEKLLKIETLDHMEKFIFMSSDAANKDFKEIVVDEGIQEVFEEDGSIFELKFRDDDSESHGTYQDLDQEPVQASESKTDIELCSPMGAFQESSAAEDKYDSNHEQFKVASDFGIEQERLHTENRDAMEKSDELDGCPESELKVSVTDPASDSQLENHNDIENQNQSVKVQNEAEAHTYTIAQPCIVDVDNMETEDDSMSDSENIDTNISSSGNIKNAIFNAENKRDLHKQPKTSNNLIKTIKCTRPVMADDESRNFNPREPNYLPTASDPEAEKVDLRHQKEDERKNAEEWMLDYELRRVLSKLAPARNRRVALLVEAFETVKPIPKYETHLSHTSATFTHIRPLQTCV